MTLDEYLTRTKDSRNTTTTTATMSVYTHECENCKKLYYNTLSQWCYICSGAVVKLKDKKKVSDL